MSLRCAVITGLLVLVLVAAARSSALVAPGAVTFPVTTTARQPSVDAFVPTLAAARPDGGAVLAGADGRGGLVLAAVRRDGSLDPAFGRGGVAHAALPAPATGPQPLELLLDARGRLLIVLG